jgi:hypothetical protein
MEAYTLWWNGRSLRNLWNTNSKVSKAIKNQFILNKSHMTMQDLKKILAFCINCAKLALSLMMTMVLVHKSKILHNDIYLSTILFYFLPTISIESILDYGIGTWQAV